MTGRFADVGGNVWVGDVDACAAHADRFPRRVHVWRGRDRDEGRVCRFHPGGDPDGMLVSWREGEGLDAMRPTFAEVRDYLARDEPTLIHCKGGVCRSATLAVVAKVLRGRDVFDAIADVYRGLWAGYREPAWLETPTMRDVLAWAERRRDGLNNPARSANVPA